MIKIDPKKEKALNVYKLMIGSITPRPIALVSTRSLDKVNNLAPYSFFTGVSVNPPAIGFSPLVNGDGRIRDSRLNIEARGEFSVNVVSNEIVERMNLAAEEVPPTVDEFNISTLSPIECEKIDVARVQESRISMECKLIDIVVIGKGPMSGAFIIGEIVCFHISEDLFEDFRIDPDRLSTVGRMGGNFYCHTADTFRVGRPGARS